ncbi:MULTISPECIES: helix-turn-helix transcriptional regulator [Rhizobium/Agrobacterium group]|uniref:Helix-turn-helix transcriptional regulator n=2 Tax=Neorhizobium TaxID=1525371 RepID=A0ABV0M5U0_9HYPH|nr:MULTISPECIES: helix-turn-helix transcriptional regulator [Rhizobium/Agrobacterium group]KGD89185.1 XRE family transcriptional regulator [Rhizobium sp. YS-1r]MCC2609420.1 helix-turn-helix domain-containing protein [Neorhizobium petrolearium]WGI69633.1 helix-turn-helix transcriptional regulator [Neorhizobium petrolearium]
MPETIFNILGTQLRAARMRRGLSQPEIAARLGRNRARISELERDLASNRWGRDRLTLFAEICDALDLIPVLVPRSRIAEVRRLIEETSSEKRQSKQTPSAFDELFIDLGEEDEEDN